MRKMAMILAAASLSACDRNVEQDDPAIAATPAQLTYDGADYKDHAAKVAHGKRLAVIFDCTGCHRNNFQGRNVTADDPDYGDMYAPNLTLLLKDYSDAELDRAIRHGVPKDGREMWFMPVEAYQFLSDADLDAIIAYLRTFEPAGTQLPPIRKGPEMMDEVARGILGNAQAQIAKFKKDPPVDLGEQHTLGRYVAQTTCASCHNNALQGWEGFTPNLDIAGAYSNEELTHLLLTGEGKSKKDLGMMSDIAKHHLSQMTAGEREAVVDYVLARANRPQSAAN